MASKVTQMCLLAIVLVVMHLTGALAQSGCTSELTSLYPCLSYVTANSIKPSPPCCSQLAGVASSKPQCLCLLLNGGGSSVGININQTLALSLPGACQVQTPPSSKCDAGNAPTTSTAAPTASPPAESSKGSPDAPKIPSVSDTPAGNGSKTVPATDGSTSAGSNINASSFPLIALFLFVASCVQSGAGF